MLLASVTIALLPGLPKAEPTAERVTAPPRVAGPDPIVIAGRGPLTVSASVQSSTPPLTRALVRARIQAIDPADWLSRFGVVERSGPDRN